MIGRKSAGNEALLFLPLLGFAVCIATYNLVTKKLESGSELAGGDPVTGTPARMRTRGRRTRQFHVAVTATDAAYSKWQCRVMYYWYKKAKDGEGSEMGAFTRVLHSGEPDSLMHDRDTDLHCGSPPSRSRSGVRPFRPTNRSTGSAPRKFPTGHQVKSESADVARLEAQRPSSPLPFRRINLANMPKLGIES